MPETAKGLPSDGESGIPRRADAEPERAAFWAVGRFDERPGYASWRPAGAGSWLLMVTDGGAGTVRQGGVQLEVTTGDAVVLGPAVAQFYGTAPAARHWRFWWVHFWMHNEWQTWLDDAIDASDPAALVFRLAGIPAGALSDLDARFRRAHAHARWPGHGLPPPPATTRLPPVAQAGSLPARQLADADVAQILLLLRAHSRTGAVTGPMPGGVDRRVDHVRALIRADPRAAHSVATLAASVRLSPSRLAHLFRDHTGHPVMREVALARLDYAARLLEATALSVAEVATASGFASPFHFSRSFSARFGLPPRDFRRAGWHTAAPTGSPPG